MGEGQRQGPRPADDEKELDGLALEQAGAYVAARRLGFAEYLERWRTNREPVLAWFDERLMKYPRSLAVTWQTSVDQLSPAARRLLERLAWLGPEPIPESLLVVPVPGEAAPPPDSFEALAELASYSLVTRSTRNPTFTVHRLLQDVTRSPHTPAQSWPMRTRPPSPTPRRGL